VDRIVGLSAPREYRGRPSSLYAPPKPRQLSNGLYLYETVAAYVRARGGGPRGYRLDVVWSETNGVGAAPTEEITRRLPGVRIVGVHSTQRSMEDAYGRLRALLAERRLVLPNDAELLRQLRGLSYQATPTGGLSINAASPALHDDLADALSFAVAAIDGSALTGQPGAIASGAAWVTTPGGRQVPKVPRPRATARLGRGHIAVGF
jgi:hypothetical protein